MPIRGDKDHALLTLVAMLSSGDTKLESMTLVTNCIDITTREDGLYFISVKDVPRPLTLKLQVTDPSTVPIVGPAENGVTPISEGAAKIIRRLIAHASPDSVKTRPEPSERIPRGTREDLVARGVYRRRSIKPSHFGQGNGMHGRGRD